MPPDETISGLLDALAAMLEAMQRLETLAQRLRDRAVNGPLLTRAESAHAERELFVVRESTEVLAGRLALFRQDVRPNVSSPPAWSFRGAEHHPPGEKSALRLNVSFRCASRTPSTCGDSPRLCRITRNRDLNVIIARGIAATRNAAGLPLKRA
jgi:hypothetical protein